MMYKMIIFDLDGTILNTIGDLNEAINYALRNNGLKEISIDDTKKYIGNGIKKLCSLACNGEKEELVYSDFKSYYPNHCLDNTFPYEGILDVINNLKDKYILGVLSNKKDELVKKIIYHFFPNIFDFSYGERDNIKRKPDCEWMNIILNEYNLSKSDILYIGDSEVDIEFAKNSRVDFLICTWGYRKKEELLHYSGVSLIDSPKHLSYLWEGIKCL